MHEEAEIVHSPLFERAIVKLQKGDENSLDDNEKRVLSVFKIPVIVSEIEDDSSGEDNFIKRAMSEVISRKKRRVFQSSYRSVLHVIPTSNMVERLFSIARGVLEDKRKRLLPRNVELILYLRMNWKLWNAETIQDIVDEE